jgi:hypothetical protein
MSDEIPATVAPRASIMKPLCPRCRRIFALTQSHEPKAGDYTVCKLCGAAVRFLPVMENAPAPPIALPVPEFLGGPAAYLGEGKPLDALELRLHAVSAHEMDRLRRADRVLYRMIMETQIRVIRGTPRPPHGNTRQVK